MNFVKTFREGQLGQNKGLWMGDGLMNVYKAINGIQRRKYFVIASAPKVGKSSFVNYGFLYSPYLQSIKENLDVTWIYYSLEMSRVDLEFDTACFFLNHDFGINYIQLPEKVTKAGKNFVFLSPSLLKGEELDDNDRTILLDKNLFQKLTIIYETRIIPLFGSYDEDGNKLTSGKCHVIESTDNPTGVYHTILDYAASRGTLKYSSNSKQSNRLIGYKPNNEKEYVIIIFDHCRKLIEERGYDEKRNIEKLSSYFIEIRNKLNYIPVNIIHLNRSLNDLERFKQFGEFLFPSGDMVKNSGNLGEDCSHMFTLFNPNDERYNLKKHFGTTIKDQGNNALYPNLRTIHLVESRHCPYPQHFSSIMEGNLKKFSQFKK